MYYECYILFLVSAITPAKEGKKVKSWNPKQTKIDCEPINLL